MILALITVGKMLEAHSKGKTTDALKSLMQLAPKTATVVRDGVEQEISVDAVKKGDIFVVRPGENIPVDGEIIDGTTAVNESALTGESIPVDKQPKDAVSAATVNQSGFIKCRATRVAKTPHSHRLYRWFLMPQRQRHLLQKSLTGYREYLCRRLLQLQSLQ